MVQTSDRVRLLGDLRGDVVVNHSHNHSLRMIYKRHFDYGGSLREFAPLSISIKSVFSYTVFEAMGDVIFVLGLRRGSVSTFEWILKAPIVRFVDALWSLQRFAWEGPSRR